MILHYCTTLAFWAQVPLQHAPPITVEFNNALTFILVVSTLHFLCRRLRLYQAPRATRLKSEIQVLKQMLLNRADGVKVMYILNLNAILFFALLAKGKIISFLVL